MHERDAPSQLEEVQRGPDDLFGAEPADEDVDMPSVEPQVRASLHLSSA